MATDENLKPCSPAASAHAHTPEEIAAIQAKRDQKKYATYESLLGAGAGLWDSDEELDEFLGGIYDRRKERE